jgi:hypothetical protein
MPIATGQYADILRALGQFLDREQAQKFEATNEDGFLSVSWLQAGPDAGDRLHIDHQLDQLNDRAKEARARGRGDPRDGWAEMLRTLGQLLDDEQLELTRLVEQDDGLLVVCSVDGNEVSHTYLIEELQAASRERRGRRRGRRADTADLDQRLSSFSPKGGPLGRRLKCPLRPVDPIDLRQPPE